MMMGDDQRAGKALGAGQRRLEEIELSVAELGRGDHAGVLKHVGIEGDDAQHRRFEGEEHAGLDLRGAGETAGLRHHLELAGAKILEKSRQRRRIRARRGHPVVIAREGDDRRRIVAIGLVELVVIISRLAEIIDHVAKVKEELRHVHRRFLVEVGGHLVGDQLLIPRAADRTGIADRVKDQLAGSGDAFDHFGAARAHDLLERQNRFRQAARHRKRDRAKLVLGIQLVDRLVGGSVGRVLDAELGRVGRRLRLREDRMSDRRRIRVIGGRRRCGRRGAPPAMMWGPCHPCPSKGLLSLGKFAYIDPAGCDGRHRLTDISRQHDEGRLSARPHRIGDASCRPWSRARQGPARSCSARPSLCSNGVPQLPYFRSGDLALGLASDRGSARSYPSGSPASSRPSKMRSRCATYRGSSLIRPSR